MNYVLYQIAIILLTVLKQNKHSALIGLLLFTLYFGASYPAGYDWIGYFANYNCLTNNQCSDAEGISFEIGFNIITYIFGSIGGYQAIIFTTAIINGVSIFLFSKNFKNLTFPFFLLSGIVAWPLYTEAIRQSIALSIILLGMNSFFQNKKIRFTLFVLTASAFHISALTCLAFNVFHIKSKPLNTALLLLGLAFPVLIFSASNSPIIIDQILATNSTLFSKLAFYLASENYKPNIVIGLGIIPDISLVIALFFIYKKTSNSTSKTLAFKGAIFYIVVAMIIGRSMPVLTRFAWYGIPFLIISLAPAFKGSQYIKTNNSLKRYNLEKVLILVFVAGQIIRPFTIEHSRLGIIDQNTIFTRINYLSDKQLEYYAKSKCGILHDINLGYLCTY
ncbi:EpsG family protein [Rhodobacteraceae bacterium CH30]|nr:EpsG family protein [Rhodobacteraceae bacterium CH30]